MRVIEIAAIAATSFVVLLPSPMLAATVPRTQPQTQPSQPSKAAVVSPAAPAVGTGVQAPAPQAPASPPVLAPAAAAAPSPVAPSPTQLPGSTQAPGTPPSTPDTAEAKPVEAPKPIVPTLIAKVNLNSQTMTVTIDGRPTYSWKVSSGAPGYDTPVGTFKPDWMAKMWHSKQYDDAPMPHSVFFKNGAAIHATQSVGRLGSPASHGCVRLSPANAETFFKLVGKHGMAMTRIAVSGKAAGRDVRHEDRIARRDTARPVQVGQSLFGSQARATSRPQSYAPQSFAMTFPGDRQSGYARPVSSNRTPYWAR